MRLNRDDNKRKNDKINFPRVQVLISDITDYGLTKNHHSFIVYDTKSEDVIICLYALLKKHIEGEE
jgi:hypothetical protein